MSYCPSSSLNRQDLLPGISAIPDGRRSCSGRSYATSPSITDPFHETTDIIDNVWTFVPSEGESPRQKVGQAIVYWQEDNSIITAYGRNRDDSFSDEFWKFSVDNNIWTKLEIEGVTPRAACGCAIVDSKMYFYGGITTSSFVKDFHIVDLSTGEVSYPVTTGEAPPACAIPMVAFYAPYLIVWAGVGTNFSYLHILDINENHWRKIETECVGRQGACGAIIDTTLYIYGASCPMSIITLDLTTFQFDLIPTSGTEPPHSLECLTMIAAGESILAFETMGRGAQTKIYVFDPSRATWSTTATAIGDSTSDSVAPRIVFYIPGERKLLALGESSSETSAPVSQLSIGKSIASLNQRIDIMTMLPTVLNKK